jgi:hypothetical protein
MYSSMELTVDRFAIPCTYMSVVCRYPYGTVAGTLVRRPRELRISDVLARGSPEWHRRRALERPSHSPRVGRRSPSPEPEGVIGDEPSSHATHYGLRSTAAR